MRDLGGPEIANVRECVASATVTLLCVCRISERVFAMNSQAPKANPINFICIPGKRANSNRKIYLIYIHSLATSSARQHYHRRNGGTHEGVHLFHHLWPRSPFNFAPMRSRIRPPPFGLATRWALIFRACKLPHYFGLIDSALRWHRAGCVEEFEAGGHQRRRCNYDKHDVRVAPFSRSSRLAPPASVYLCLCVCLCAAFKASLGAPNQPLRALTRAINFDGPLSNLSAAANASSMYKNTHARVYASVGVCVCLGVFIHVIITESR